MEIKAYRGNIVTPVCLNFHVSPSLILFVPYKPNNLFMDHRQSFLFFMDIKHMSESFQDYS